MAAKGSVAKEEITQQILQIFPGSFVYGKELRIPYVENGEQLQIKVALTCAKVAVEAGGDTALPGSAPVVTQNRVPAAPKTEVKATQSEIDNVANMMAKLGF